MQYFAMFVAIALLGCSASSGGAQGDPGRVGPQGPPGPQGPAGESGAASGSRIAVQAHRLVGTDGAQIPTGYGFYDNFLKTPCVPITAADLTTRCLPPTPDTWGAIGSTGW